MAERFVLREYRDSDYGQICELMEVFQQYLTDLDTMNIVMVEKNYGKKYTDETLKDLALDNGKFLIAHGAEKPETIIGFAIGIVPQKVNPFHVIGHIAKREGIVTELFVLEKFRGLGVASKLVGELEKYFVANGCNYSRIAVMSDNEGAYQAYHKMGYQDRTVELLKKIVV